MNKTLFAACLLACAPAAQAITVLEYETAASTTNPSLAPSAVAAGVTGFDMTAGPGIASRSGSTWVWRAWTEDDGSVNASADDALLTDHYWSWGFTSTQAYDLEAFDIRLDRSGTGPNMFDILLSVNGGAATSILSDDFGASDTARNYYDIDLSAFGDVSEATFTLAAFGADTGGATSLGTFDLERVAFRDYAFQLRGNVSAVPLPFSGLMLIGGIAVLGSLRRKT